MNAENRKRIVEAARRTGDELNGRLPEHRNHPDGRNSYAHVWSVLKSRFGDYKERPDDEFDDIMRAIESCKSDL